MGECVRGPYNSLVGEGVRGVPLMAGAVAADAPKLPQY